VQVDTNIFLKEVLPTCMDSAKQIFCLKLAFYCHSLTNKFYRDLGKHQLLPSSVFQMYFQWWISTIVFLHSRNRRHGMMLVNAPTAGKSLARPCQPMFHCCLLLWQAGCSPEGSTRPPSKFKKNNKELLNAHVALGEMLNQTCRLVCYTILMS